MVITFLTNWMNGFYKMATQLPQLGNVEQLSSNVVRVMGGNPSKVGQLLCMSLDRPELV